IAVTVTNENDNTPSITSGASFSVAENKPAVTTVNASDAEGTLNALTLSNSGGADSSSFSINSTTGVLTFNSAPDYESPTDVVSNNVYNVTVQTLSLHDALPISIAVTVTNENDNTPSITSGASFSVAE